MTLSLTTPRLGRVLIASLALVANLVATGVPVLHAWAHEVVDVHHAHAEVTEGVEHSHEEVHPDALHADCLMVQRVAVDLGFALPMQPPELVNFVTEATLPVHPVPPMSSRAPPPPSQARAPPPV
jgi:hypothetical protein